MTPKMKFVLIYHNCLKISLFVAGGESDSSSKGIIGIASSTRTTDTYFLILVSNIVVYVRYEPPGALSM